MDAQVLFIVNRDTYMFELCTPRMNNAPAQSVTNKYTYKHYIFAPTAWHALFDHSQTFHGDRGREIIKKFSYF